MLNFNLGCLLKPSAQALSVLALLMLSAATWAAFACIKLLNFVFNIQAFVHIVIYSGKSRENKPPTPMENPSQCSVSEETWFHKVL